MNYGELIEYCNVNKLKAIQLENNSEQKQGWFENDKAAARIFNIDYDTFILRIYSFNECKNVKITYSQEKDKLYLFENDSETVVIENMSQYEDDDLFFMYSVSNNTYDLSSNTICCIKQIFSELVNEIISYKG